MKKTLQEVYDEVMKSNDLKKALAEAMKAGKVTDFLKANGCEATQEELKDFVAAKAAEDQPIGLTDEELEKVAGGYTVPSTRCSQVITDSCCKCK